jgi:hypothetical protein
VSFYRAAGLWRFLYHNVGKGNIKVRDTSLALYQRLRKNTDKARLVTVRAIVLILLQKSNVTVRCRDSYNASEGRLDSMAAIVSEWKSACASASQASAAGVDLSDW